MTINFAEIAALIMSVVALLSALGTALNNRRKASVDDFNAVSKGYQSLCADLTLQISALRERVKCNDAKIQVLEKELKESRSENAQLRIEVDQLRHENEQLREQISTLRIRRKSAAKKNNART